MITEAPPTHRQAHAAGKHRSRRRGACCGCATRPTARLTIGCRVPPAARRRRSCDCRATVEEVQKCSCLHGTSVVPSIMLKKFFFAWPVVRESHLEDPAHRRARKAPTTRAANPPAGLGPVHYLLSRRNYSITSRIASSRSHFFLSVHRLIRASFPFLEVVMKTLLNSCSIRQSTLWAF